VSWYRIYEGVGVRVGNCDLRQYIRVNGRKGKETVKIIKGVIKFSEFLGCF